MCTDKKIGNLKATCWVKIGSNFVANTTMTYIFKNSTKFIMFSTNAYIFITFFENIFMNFINFYPTKLSKTI